MVKIYVSLIKRGLKTLEDVPVQIRAQVEAALAAESTEALK